MKIFPTGYWEGLDGHGTDKGLMAGLYSFFKKENIISVVDLGCGNGDYVKFLLAKGISAIGIDGNPNTFDLVGDEFENYFYIADLTKQIFQPSFKTDYVLCLEVGEHIPEEYVEVLFKNIHFLNTKGVIISWATPNQGGDGHINCQPNSYVIDKFQSLGYTHALEDQNTLRESCAKYPTPCYWFRDTLMVFKR